MKTKQSADGRRLAPVGLQSVAIDDTFWAHTLQTLRSVTLDDVLSKFEADGAFANFDRVAQGLRGGHKGAPWFDGLIFETMRGASDFLATAYDPQLDARLDGYIERIAAAQAADPDGYLNTFVTLMCPDRRWGANGSDQLWSHEEYDAGCLVEAAVHHYRATHKTSLLRLAARFADYLCAYMGPAFRHNVVPSHSLPEEALLKLAVLFRDEPELAAQLSSAGAAERYVELVRFWIDNRGHHQGRTSFTEYAQDHRPLAEQDQAVGHAVRATLLYTGLAALANELDAPEYRQVSARLWQDVVERKLFITGGAGAINQYEGFGFGYYLPSDGYNETCAGVGMAFWASQMNQAFASAEYADIFEREIYNNVLAGVSLEGNQYSYQNPLVNHGKLHRWHWHGCPCCPPMLLKLYGNLGEQIYAHDHRDIFVNQYIGSTATIALAAGELEIALRSELPWQGAAAATLRMQHSQDFALRLRVPSWCPQLRVTINRQPHPAPNIADGYAVLDRRWSDGDTVELELAMPILRMIAHPAVNQLRERVALQRGPLVYCLEGVDNPGTPEPVLAADPQLGEEYRADLLGGVMTIVGRAQDGALLRAVPYYAWDNRKAPDAEQDWMAVWLRQADGHALRHQLEGDNRKGWDHALYRPLAAAPSR